MTKTGKKALTEAQVNKLLEYCTNLRDKTLFTLAISTGLRRLDIVNIRRKDINLDKKELSFTEHKKNRIWKVPLNQSTCSLISMYLKVSPKSTYLFFGTYNNKNHLSSKQAYNLLQDSLKKAGLPQRPFHALRSTCVKLCLKHGWTWEQISELTGDLISTLQCHYSTPSDEEMKQVAQDKSIL